MAKAGFVRDLAQTQATVTSACQRLCDDLKKRDCSPTRGPSFGRDRFMKIVSSVRFRNKARVVRDITPLVVPSPELLTIEGYHGMDQMREALGTEWIQYDAIYAPPPKPDLAIGISSTAFTEDEKEKLELSYESAYPNLFPENLYYPFLICQVMENSDMGIEEAERHSMYSASIAVQAVVRLYQNISAANEVDRKILAFSVVHNGYDVKIFGHFALVEEQKLTFFRHSLYATDLNTEERTKPYSIVRAIYDVFFPQHLARIKGALNRLPGPTFTPQLEPDEDFQESTGSLPSSQEQGKFKRPSLPSTSRMLQENERLRDEMSRMLRQHQEENVRLQEHFSSMLRKQGEQQMEESREQRASLERQLAHERARSAEIMTLLKEMIPK